MFKRVFMKSLFKNDKSNLYKASNDGKRMDYVLKDIIANRQSVEAYGNVFDFRDVYLNLNEFKPFDLGGVVVNGKRTISNIGLLNDKLFLRSIDAYINFNGKKFYKPFETVLNSDFSIERIIILNEKDNVVTDDETKQESFLFPAKGQIVYVHNFYTFDKDENIVGMKQQVTYSVFIDEKKLNSMLKNEEKMLKDVKKKLKNEEKMLKNATKNNETSEKLKKKINEEELKINLFKQVRKEAKINEIPKSIKITFTEDYACVLVDDNNLFFFKEDEKQNKYNLDGNLDVREYYVKQFTAFEDKVILSSENYSNRCLESKEDHEIEIVNIKDKKVEITIKLPYFEDVDNEDEYRCLLSRMNFVNCEPRCDYEQFQKKLKVFFDKNIIEKKNKEEEMKKKEKKEQPNKNNIKGEEEEEEEEIDIEEEEKKEGNKKKVKKDVKQNLEDKKNNKRNCLIY